MAYDPGAIEAALSAALGEDAALIVELRQAFMESAARAVASLRAADDAQAWTLAAQRLKGLAASFGAIAVIALADEAIANGPDLNLLTRLERTLARL